jgi:hypothetical protein
MYFFFMKISEEEHDSNIKRLIDHYISLGDDYMLAKMKADLQISIDYDILRGIELIEEANVFEIINELYSPDRKV